MKNLPEECNFGHLQSIMLPPYCVSIPRTDVPLETILGFQLKKKDSTATVRSVSEEMSASEQQRKDAEEYPSPKDKDKDEGLFPFIHSFLPVIYSFVMTDASHAPDIYLLPFVTSISRVGYIYDRATISLFGFLPSNP